MTVSNGGSAQRPEKPRGDIAGLDFAPARPSRPVRRGCSRAPSARASPGRAPAPTNLGSLPAVRTAQLPAGPRQRRSRPPALARPACASQAAGQQGRIQAGAIAGLRLAQFHPSAEDQILGNRQLQARFARIGGQVRSLVLVLTVTYPSTIVLVAIRSQGDWRRPSTVPKASQSGAQGFGRSSRSPLHPTGSIDPLVRLAGADMGAVDRLITLRLDSPVPVIPALAQHLDCRRRQAPAPAADGGGGGASAGARGQRMPETGGGGGVRPHGHPAA